MQKTLDILKWLKKSGKITTQQFKTFKGQVLSGNEAGCLKGLRRLNLI